MFSPGASQVPFKNLLLSALSSGEYEHLLPALELVRLPRDAVLYETGRAIRYAYFLIAGMVSLLSVTEDGRTIEVGMIGHEGLVGIPVILGISIAPYRTTVQIPASALRIRADRLRGEFNRGGTLQAMLLKYTHTLITQLSQSAVCNRFHTAEERLCRWLLISRDRVHSNTISLTQETISQMLGVPRTGVTLTAGLLQQNGLIRYRRGKITILDPRGLEDTACECYRVIREEFEHFLAA
jgi:CRP-like cAMP-binding protein